MNGPATSHWQPTTFLRFEEAYDTSTGTARIVTDAGPAYVKAMGNPEGPRPLACELVGTQLARWLGLPTLDFALMRIDADVDEIPFFGGGMAASGPAFVTRAVQAHPWSGSEADLDGLDNPEAVSWLVVFDTWTRNCDRYAPHLTRPRVNTDNVLLEKVGDKESGGLRFVAIDHGCCFTCGRELTPRLAHITPVQDPALYGLFPACAARVREDDVKAAIDRLRELEEDAVAAMIEKVPGEWEVDQGTRVAWRELVCRRAAFVADTILDRIAKVCWPGQLFDTGPKRRTNG